MSELTAKAEFEAYVRGMAAGVPLTVVNSLRQFGDDIAREAAKAALEPHPFTNDQGGDFVCTVCWKDRPGHGK